MTQMNRILRRADRASAFAALLLAASVTAAVSAGIGAGIAQSADRQDTESQSNVELRGILTGSGLTASRGASSNTSLHPRQGSFLQAASLVAPASANLRGDLLQPAIASVDDAALKPSPEELARVKLAAEQRCLAEAMYYEARGEGADGEEAVAEVVFHRVHMRGYPRSICGVVYQGASEGSCQFSFVCNGEMDKPKNAAAWRHAALLADKILHGYTQLGDTTNGATAFHATDVEPDWSGLERTVQIGNHVFYRPLGRTRAS